MTEIVGLKVLFVAGFGPLVRDPEASKAFYVDTLGLPLEAMPADPDYFHSEKLTEVDGESSRGAGSPQSRAKSLKVVPMNRYT